MFLMKNKRGIGVRCEVDVWLPRFFSCAAIANVGRSFCIAGQPMRVAAVIGPFYTTSKTE